MKRIIACILLSALLLSLCACGEKQDNNQASATNEAVPTEAAEATEPAATEAVTPEPTLEPTPEATEEPTPEPTATPEPTPTPEPVAVDFESCAEAVVSVPWGEGELEAYYDPLQVGHSDQPGCFYIADGRIYVLDRFHNDDTSLLVYDIESDELSRLNVFGTKYGVGTEFAVEGNELITPYMIYNVETGEETLLQEPPIEGSNYECVRRLHKVDGSWYLYVSEPMISTSSNTANTAPVTMEYKLDRENRLWKSVRRYLCNREYRHVQIEDGTSYAAVLDRGTVNGTDQYVDYDGSGCHYVVTFEYRATEEGSKCYLVLTKYSPEGVQLSFTELFLDPINWRNYAAYWYHDFRVEEDGTVWFMMMYDTGLTIYKLHI